MIEVSLEQYTMIAFNLFMIGAGYTIYQLFKAPHEKDKDDDS